jgi:hypothetical protein
MNKICGCALLGLVVLGVSACTARRPRDEVLAVDVCRRLVVVQELYKRRDMDGNGSNDYAPSLELLFRSRAIVDEELLLGSKGNYRFEIQPEGNPVCSWALRAEPIFPERTEGRFLFVDETGVIRAEVGGAAGPHSPPVGGS